MLLNKEFTKEEIEELKKKINELNEILNQATRKKELAGYSKLRPLGHLTGVKNREPQFGFSKIYDTDVWKCFLQLAKCLHTKTGCFYMQQPTPYRAAFINQTDDKKIRKLEELTPEQLKISGEMIDKMIAIYNTYYFALHRYVNYRDLKEEESKCIVTVPTEDKYKF